MSQIVEFRSEEDRSLLVEVEDDRGARVMRGGRTADAVIEAGVSLETMLGGLGTAVKGIVSQVRAAADWPDEVEIEFGVKVSADANVIIARTTGEANFRIAMKWSTEPGDRQRGLRAGA